jgi:hypothetical protein
MKAKIWAGLVAAGPFAAAVAQTPLSERLAECRELRSDSERLRCYDAMSDSEEAVVLSDVSSRSDYRPDMTTPGPGTAPTPAVSPEERGAEKRPASIAPLARETARANLSVQAKVVRFWRDRRGKALILLDNEEVWVETSASKFVGELTAGTIVTLSREGLGWYRLRVEGVQGTMAVRRAR